MVKIGKSLLIKNFLHKISSKTSKNHESLIKQGVIKSPTLVFH